MQYHESSLSDFNGYLLVDTHSNQYLNLTLSKFRGTLHGLVTGLDSTQAIQISTGSPGLTRDESEDEGEAADTVWKEVRVTGILCNKLGQVGVSLHPSGKKAESRVKQLRCLESGLREFRRVEAGYQGDDAGANTFRQNQREEDSDESWGSYLNPVNWVMAAATGGWGVTKSLVLALAVVTWAAVIFCCVKLLCCLNVCSRNK